MKKRAWNYSQVTKTCLNCHKKFNVQNYRKKPAVES